jgi:hypothetical protein
MSKAEIRKVLSGLNTSILLHREKCRKNPSLTKKSKNWGDVNAWRTLEELEKNGYF